MFPNDKICTAHAAKQAAKSIFNNYLPKTQQTHEGVEKMMKETYQAMNMDYQPTTLDISSLSVVMDLNKDGKITLQDLQSLALKYLCGVQHQKQPSNQ